MYDWFSIGVTHANCWMIAAILLELFAIRTILSACFFYQKGVIICLLLETPQLANGRKLLSVVTRHSQSHHQKRNCRSCFKKKKWKLCREVLTFTSTIPNYSDISLVIHYKHSQSCNAIPLSKETYLPNLIAIRKDREDVDTVPYISRQEFYAFDGFLETTTCRISFCNILTFSGAKLWII
jgi:hypothetical protein